MVPNENRNQNAKYQVHILKKSVQSLSLSVSPGTASHNALFSLAIKGKLTKERTEQCHGALITFVVDIFFFSFKLFLAFWNQSGGFVRIGINKIQMIPNPKQKCWTIG